MRTNTIYSGNWSKGTIAAPDTGNTYKYWVKHFEDPSETYGIDGGRISKLTIRKTGDYTDLYNYDRGLDKDCQNDEVKTVLDIILAKYN